MGSPHLTLDWGKIKIGSPKRTTGLKSLNFAAFPVWTWKMKEFSKLRFVYLKYVDNWSGNLHFFFHIDTAASMCSMNYCSSQLARLRHTFINLNLHYHTVLIYHLFESFPYSVFFNYFVFIKSSNFENSLFCQFYGNCWKWCAFKLHSAKQRNDLNINKSKATSAA